MRNVARIISRWEWIILLLLLPLFMFPEGTRGLVLLVIPILWLIRLFAGERLVPATPYNVALLLLVAMLGIGMMTSYDPALSGPKAAGILAGIALLLAITGYSRHSSLWSIVAVFLAIGVMMALVGLFGSVWAPPFDFLNNARALLPGRALAVPGAVGGLVNPNELAGVLGWVAPLAFACTIGMSRRLWRDNKVVGLALAATTLLLSFVLVATSSRGGILALCAAIVVVLAFFIPPRWRLVLVIGFVVSLLIIVSYGSASLGQDLVGDTLGLNGRLEIWARALLAIEDFPLTGVGLNAFRRVVHVLYPLFEVSPDIDLAHAHNHVFQAALDLGLPGLIGYLALWFISVGLLWSTAVSLRKRGATRHPYYSLVAGLSGSLVAGWVFGLFDVVALGSRPAFLWWLLLGMTASVNYAVRHSGEKLRRGQLRISFFRVGASDRSLRSPAMPASLESES